MAPWTFHALHSYSPSSFRPMLLKWNQRPCLSSRPLLSPRLSSFFFHSTFGVGLRRRSRSATFVWRSGGGRRSDRTAPPPRAYDLAGGNHQLTCCYAGDTQLYLDFTLSLSQDLKLSPGCGTSTSTLVNQSSWLSQPGRRVSGMSPADGTGQDNVPHYLNQRDPPPCCLNRHNNPGYSPNLPPMVGRIGS